MTAAHLCMLQLATTTPTYCHNLGMSASNPTPSELQPLIQCYQDVFQDPEELPPSRGHFDHRIPLKEGTSPINLRPYKYPLKHKDIIEQLVQQMLDQGVIQASCSPFASPVVLVGKKDGTW